MTASCDLIWFIIKHLLSSAFACLLFQRLKIIILKNSASESLINISKYSIYAYDCGTLIRKYKKRV